jgi:hypothetical protein
MVSWIPLTSASPVLFATSIPTFCPYLLLFADRVAEKPSGPKEQSATFTTSSYVDIGKAEWLLDIG